MTSSYGRLTLPDDPDSPIILDLRDSALEFAVCTRAGIGRLPDIWCSAGTYLLIGGLDEHGRTQAYVGKASRLRDRIKDHVTNKPWWNRAILLQSKSREGFTTADAAWMEGEVIQRLLGWESVVLENRSPCASIIGLWGKTLRSFIDAVAKQEPSTVETYFSLLPDWSLGKRELKSTVKLLVESEAPDEEDEDV